MHDSDTQALFSYVLEQLSARGIAYAHLIDPRATSAGGSDAVASEAPSTSQLFRALFKGVFLSAGGYTRDNAMEVVAKGEADAVVFGRYYISNPDLAERLQKNLPLNPYDRSTFYGGAEKGYTDYPFYSEAAAA
jgi:N-ethylmaleimide reductase